MAFCKVVSAIGKGNLSQRRLLPAETAVCAVHMELHYSTVIVENKFMVLVVREQLAIEDT